MRGEEPTATAAPYEIDPERVVESFTDRVQMLRESAELTPLELATRSNIPLSVVNDIEAGLVDPPLSLMMLLAVGLNLDVSYLFIGIAGRRPPQRRGTMVPPPEATPDEARRAWAAIRVQLRDMYENHEAHHTMMVRLGLTRAQLKTQLHQLFQEGMQQRPRK